MFKSCLVLVLVATFMTSGCAALELNPTKWNNSLFTASDAPVGTPAWWKANKGEAEFVPGEGYRVTGVEGYFDQEGRPIQTKVAKKVDEVKSRGILKDVQFQEAVSDIKSQVGLGADESKAKFAFDKGEDLFQREKYAEAAKEFKETIARAPKTNLSQDAMFLLAESYFFSHHYADAVEAYDKLLEENASTKHADKIIRRQFEIARYWDKHHQNDPQWSITPNFFDKTRPFFDTRGRSLKIYENIRLNDPTGPLADDSIMATANSFFLRGRYEDADYHYEQIRTEYPQSEHQFEAHILGLQCKLKKYQGHDYDGTPLLEAKRLVKQIKQQFAGKLDEEERSRLDLDEAALIKQLASRELRRAKFYEGNEYNEGARFHYANVLRRYPGTPIANEAQQQYAALEGKPAKPTELFESVVNLLPRNEEREAIQQIPLLEPATETLIARPPADPSGDTPILR